ncbi:AGE family epimerase/isomerase [Allofournierella sp.]|uniref:AGE family epimerase/isomerase n=1 Tax=Allofournierella sp. TaxID=1940256 RepID=UPI003AB7DBCB
MDERLAGAREQLREMLFENVMPFWERHAVDAEYGGYLTGLDRRGRVWDDRKNTWMQGRMVWMFSTLAAQDPAHREQWLALARPGRDFLLDHAWAGQGRWNYVLSRRGEVEQGSVSLYADLFALEGLAQYILASGDAAGQDQVRLTAAAVARELEAGVVKRIAPQAYVPGAELHGVYMIALNSLAPAQRLLGGGALAGLRARLLERILGRFADPARGVVLEERAPGGAPAGGGRINPGHTFESMVFCLEAAEQLKLPCPGAAAILRHTWALARDRENGGVLYMLNADGSAPHFADWIAPRALRWDEKVWWTHAEALPALLWAAHELKDPACLEEFLALWQYCRTHFADPVYGEWYYALHRGGAPRLQNKGGFQKCAFHLPRALLKSVQLIDRFYGG